MLPAPRHPGVKLSQCQPANHGLHFCHSPIRAKRVVQPSEDFFCCLFVDSVPVFAVILKTPGPFPYRGIVGRQHAPFATSCHDFILAEREGGSIAQ